MFFDDLTKIEELARNTGFAIFVVDQSVIAPNSNLKTAKTPKDFFEAKRTFVAPTKPDTGKIGIDEVREIIEYCRSKQSEDCFVIIENASTLTAESQDALLKILEEPKEHYHFAIFTTDLGPLLETVRSRASIFVQKHLNSTTTPPAISKETLDYAKKLLAATPRTVIPLVEELTGPKFSKKPREPIIEIVQTAIELAYKSYFITKNPAFIAKISKLLRLERNLKGNGNLKLQLIANLI